VLLAVLDELARLGIPVVASAGNDATRRPLFPAGFAPHPGGPVSATDPAAVPLSSVGALNPDGSVALFSNSGTWVVRWEPGAALVSTLPETFAGGLNPLASAPDPTGRQRRALDPDDFTAGFAVGSGTSYAAPVFAGRIAAELLAQSVRPGGIPLSDTGDRAVKRARDAVEACLAR
jgi:subtilisin family serine protease